MKKAFATLCSVLLIFSLVFAFASCDISEDAAEDTTEALSYTQGSTVLGKNSEEVLTYFNTLVNGVKDQTPAVAYEQKISVDNKTIKITKPDGTEDSSFKKLNEAAPGIKDLILTDIKKKSGSVSYGDENEDVFFVKGENWSSALTVDDIQSAVMKEVGDSYLITISFGTVPESARTTLSKAFELRDKATILKASEFAKVSAYAKFNDYTVEYSGCTISATVDRLTDTLQSVSYNKISKIAADVTGLSTFAEYGDMIVNFVLNDSTSFTFTWAQEYETSPLDTTSVS